MSSPDATASDPTAAPSGNDPDLSPISTDTADAELVDDHEPLDLDAIERELAEIETFLEHGDDEHGDDEHGDDDQPDTVDLTVDMTDDMTHNLAEDAPDHTDATAAAGDADPI